MRTLTVPITLKGKEVILEEFNREVFTKLGFLEGKIDGLETWRVTFEASIAERLKDINSNLESMNKVLNKGIGAKIVLVCIAGAVLSLPQLDQVYALLFN